MVYLSPEIVVRQRTLATREIERVRGSCVDTGTYRDAENNLC